jgi:CHASE3 domain sensor protein
MRQELNEKSEEIVRLRAEYDALKASEDELKAATAAKLDELQRRFELMHEKWKSAVAAMTENDDSVDIVSILDIP